MNLNHLVLHFPFVLVTDNRFFLKIFIRPIPFPRTVKYVNMSEFVHVNVKISRLNRTGRSIFLRQFYWVISLPTIWLETISPTDFIRKLNPQVDWFFLRRSHRPVSLVTISLTDYTQNNFTRQLILQVDRFSFKRFYRPYSLVTTTFTRDDFTDRSRLSANFTHDNFTDQLHSWSQRSTLATCPILRSSVPYHCCFHVFRVPI